MTRQEIEARLAKAQEAVTKKENLLQKYIKKEGKIRQQIIEAGWDIDAGRYQKHGTPEHNDCYWTFCDLSDVEDSIKRTRKAIEEKKGIVQKWESKLADQIQKEAEKDLIPDILKQYEGVLIDHFDKNDEDRKSFLKAQYKELGYEKFCKKYHGTGYNLMHESAEESHKKNVRTAEALVKNLWVRVEDICKDVDDCELFLSNANEWEGICINGFVKGTAGTAKVESILAGGYNIQKLHIRTLVHRI